jgi:Zn-dependent M28 family amino/carboxypeptidase
VLGVLGTLSLWTLASIRNGNRSPGGVDNAGSVGILVELARLLPGRLPEDVELIFLSPGAEEDHMVGAMRWLDEHAAELQSRPTWALNFDGAGIPGRVTLLERYGLGKMFSPDLSRVARAAARRLGIPVRGVLLPPAMGVDAIPFAHRGIDCLTFASGSLNRATLAVHSASDRFEHVDGEALVQVARLGIEVARALIADA